MSILRETAKVMVFLVVLATIPFLSAPIAQAEEWVVSAPSAATFYVHHPMHEVVGTSSALYGTITFAETVSNGETALDLSGLVKKFVQVDWKTFDSGNGSRDDNILKFVDATKFPTITFQVAEVGNTKKEGNAWVADLVGRLYVKGTKKEIAVPVRFIKEGNGYRLRARIASALTAHGIEPPKLLFVETDDPFEIDVDMLVVPK